MNNLLEQDLENRQIALDVTQSFIVQAPAGSGKTELLIQRFLNLLNYVSTPQEILAITFTKKAANEMRMRIVKALKQAENDAAPESAHAKKTWTLAKKILERDQKFNWQLINNPNQLRIQTIDSLCAFLTKQLPLLSHFGSQPEIADNPQELYREAVQEILKHVEENFAWSEAISHLLLHLDNDLNKLHDLLINLLAKRDQWLPYIHFDTDNNEIKKQLENYLSDVISDSVSTVQNLFPKALIPDLIDILNFVGICHSEASKEPWQSQNFNFPQWLNIAKLLLTKSFTFRKRVDEEIGFPPLNSLKNPQEKLIHKEYRTKFAELINQLIEKENLREALENLFFLPDAKLNDTQWKILQSLLLILKILVAQLRVSFQQHGQIDFIENTQGALIALGHEDAPTDLALSLDYQIKHILVDEFQDTSITQYHLLEKLTAGWEAADGRTLFVVGDPMQSIYRFREAEVGLFIRMWEKGLRHIALTPLSLSVNFRSTEKIVAWNNGQFQKIFPNQDNIATGAVSFKPSVAQNISDNPISNISITGLTEFNETDQAKQIVQVVKETLQAYPHEKIAILVRSRSHLSNIIPELKKEKIKFSAVDIDPLASKQIIQDLFSLTCAMLHPADRISWLAILRAPWCGLELADLLAIAGNDPYSTIFEELTQENIQQKLTSNGKERLSKFFTIIKNKMAERERYSLRYWIESTWYLLGGPASLQNVAEIEDANAFFNLLEKFGEQHCLDLKKLSEKINQLYATSNHDDAPLQIMTIFSAKGLEFDTVILPHLEREISSDDKSLLLWMEQPLKKNQSALLLAAIHAVGQERNAIYEYIQRQQKTKANYEIERLLYVATTRAKKRLCLFFNTKQKENGNYSLGSGSFLEKLWPLLEKNKDEIIISVIKEQHEEKQNSIRGTRRLISSWQNPVCDTPHQVSPHQKVSGWRLQDNKFRMVGTVIHRILQQVANNGMNWWQDKNIDQQNKYLLQQFTQIGLVATDFDFAIKATQQALQNALADSRGQWILASHPNAQSEFSITANINDAVENLIIDRTFVDDQGVRWIIDYKTTALSHEDLEAFLNREQEKYLVKMNKYAQALQLMEDRPMRLGLYFPALPAWKEWEG